MNRDANDWEDQEVSFEVDASNCRLKRCDPQDLPRVLWEWAKLERACKLAPLPPDHWVWEALRQLEQNGPGPK
jgi:hypothetical protein